MDLLNFVILNVGYIQWTKSSNYVTICSNMLKVVKNIKKMSKVQQIKTLTNTLN